MAKKQQTKEPWTIEWYICTADQSDVEYDKKQKKPRGLKVGDELWRKPVSIGPISADHDHWSGWSLSINEEEAYLVSAAPEMLEALKMIVVDDTWGLEHDVYMKCKAAIAKAEGKYQ